MWIEIFKDKEGKKMEQKDLKKLGRKELLELLLIQTRRTEELEKKVEEVTAECEEKIAKMQEKLDDRSLTVEKAGSIAEAAMKVNTVFEDAQRAADDYIANIKARLFTTEERILKAETESAAKIARAEQESKRKCDRMLAETTQTCEDMVTIAKEKADSYWLEVESKLNSYYETHKGLREMLAIFTKA